MIKHFTFVITPGHGHVNPTLPLVEELVSRGHRVTYVTGARMLPAVARIGATAVERLWDPSVLAPGTGEPFDPAIVIAAILRTQELLEQTYPAMVAHFQQDRPDAVCYDTLDTLGPQLAEKLGVPAVELIPSMASNEHFNLRSVLAPGRNPDAMRTVFADVIEARARFRAANGLSTLGVESLIMNPPASLNLVFVPREFQIAGDTFDDRFQFLGPALGSRAGTGDWQPPADGSPVLFVSLGTLLNNRPAFFAQCIEAFRDSRWHVVMAVGETATLPPVPGNFEVAPYFPQPLVLARAALFVSHAGINSTMESLYSGVPLVSVPQMPEQALNGGRVEELGLGRRLAPEAITPQLLRQTVDEVANSPAIRTNVTKFGEQLRAVNAAALGADALERLLG
jgi:MGT family glycosyltransferase